MTGTVNEIDEGEGGEQGDLTMPLLFSLGQHAVVRSVQHQLVNVRVFAFLDDVWVVCAPHRVSEVYATQSGTGVGCGLLVAIFWTELPVL